MTPFPAELLRLGPLVVTDTVVLSLLISLALLLGLRVAMSIPRAREVLEIGYDILDQQVKGLTGAEVGPLVPLILTMWLFIGVANLLGLVPAVASPTRDLGLAVALASISFLAGHIYALRTNPRAYLHHYIEPNPFLLPFNILGEVSRTIALALRLFGNMLSATLVGAIFVYLAGLLVPVPLMLLSVLTSVVQAYIFGVLTLVFAASSIEVASRPRGHGRSSDDTAAGDGVAVQGESS
ncbi:F0F1 ATP synthase subunit A [Haliangium sp.]|uniref:F0F1 ATP synthase subunit A n=1 Tax=Haliangium sp. TaxID=2663208 RepID=UPI003D104338